MKKAFISGILFVLAILSVFGIFSINNYAKANNVENQMTEINIPEDKPIGNNIEIAKFETHFKPSDYIHDNTMTIPYDSSSYQKVEQQLETNVSINLAEGQTIEPGEIKIIIPFDSKPYEYGSLTKTDYFDQGNIIEYDFITESFNGDVYYTVSNVFNFYANSDYNFSYEIINDKENFIDKNYYIQGLIFTNNNKIEDSSNFTITYSINKYIGEIFNENLCDIYSWIEIDKGDNVLSLQNDKILKIKNELKPITENDINIFSTYYDFISDFDNINSGNNVYYISNNQDFIKTALENPDNYYYFVYNDLFSNIYSKDAYIRNLSINKKSGDGIIITTQDKDLCNKYNLGKSNYVESIYKNFGNLSCYCKNDKNISYIIDRTANTISDLIIAVPKKQHIEGEFEITITVTDIASGETSSKIETINIDYDFPEFNGYVKPSSEIKLTTQYADEIIKNDSEIDLYVQESNFCGYPSAVSTDKNDPETYETKFQHLKFSYLSLFDQQELKNISYEINDFVSYFTFYTTMSNNIFDYRNTQSFNNANNSCDFYKKKFNKETLEINDFIKNAKMSIFYEDGTVENSDINFSLDIDEYRNSLRIWNNNININGKKNVVNILFEMDTIFPFVDLHSNNSIKIKNNNIKNNIIGYVSNIAEDLDGNVLYDNLNMQSDYIKNNIINVLHSDKFEFNNSYIATKSIYKYYFSNYGSIYTDSYQKKYLDINYNSNLYINYANIPNIKMDEIDDFAKNHSYIDYYNIKNQKCYILATKNIKINPDSYNEIRIKDTGISLNGYNLYTYDEYNKYESGSFSVDFKMNYMDYLKLGGDIEIYCIKTIDNSKFAVEGDLVYDEMNLLKNEIIDLGFGDIFDCQSFLVSKTTYNSVMNGSVKSGLYLDTDVYDKVELKNDFTYSIIYNSDAKVIKKPIFFIKLNNNFNTQFNTYESNVQSKINYIDDADLIDQGIDPKYYYTTDDIDLSDPNIDYTKWSSEIPDSGNVTIAVDLSKKIDGSDFITDKDSYLYFYINCNAFEINDLDKDFIGYSYVYLKSEESIDNLNFTENYINYGPANIEYKIESSISPNFTARYIDVDTRKEIEATFYNINERYYQDIELKLDLKYLKYIYYLNKNVNFNIEYYGDTVIISNITQKNYPNLHDTINIPKNIPFTVTNIKIKNFYDNFYINANNDYVKSFYIYENVTENVLYKLLHVDNDVINDYKIFYDDNLASINNDIIELEINKEFTSDNIYSDRYYNIPMKLIYESTEYFNNNYINLIEKDISNNKNIYNDDYKTMVLYIKESDVEDLSTLYIENINHLKNSDVIFGKENLNEENYITIKFDYNFNNYCYVYNTKEFKISFVKIYNKYNENSSENDLFSKGYIINYDENWNRIDVDINYKRDYFDSLDPYVSVSVGGGDNGPGSIIYEDVKLENKKDQYNSIIIDTEDIDSKTIYLPCSLVEETNEIEMPMSGSNNINIILFTSCIVIILCLIISILNIKKKGGVV